jgi:HSP20 family protein
MFNLTPWRKEEKAGALESRQYNYPLARMREEFESLFDRFFGGLPLGGEGFDFEPCWAFDVDESGKDVVVRAEAPGFEPKDFEVELSGNVLHIRAEQKREEEKKKEKVGYTECRYARFERLVTLPEYTDRSKVEASYRNGVLEVRVPKTAEAQGKRIEVKP